MDTEKKVYVSPKLVEYGELGVVTQFGPAGPTDGITGSSGSG